VTAHYTLSTLLERWRAGAPHSWGEQPEEAGHLGDLPLNFRGEKTHTRSSVSNLTGLDKKIKIVLGPFERISIRQQPNKIARIVVDRQRDGVRITKRHIHWNLRELAAIALHVGT